MNGTPRGLLGGLSLGEIPIAGSKRRSMAISLGGKLYRVGRISPNMAFVIMRGNLRLLYVAPEYKNYRYAARKIFGNHGPAVDIDHVLGRKLTQQHNFWYTLVARIDSSVNRSHGSRERPVEMDKKGVNLEKYCYTDERIIRKVTGVLSNNGYSGEGIASRSTGYGIVKSHDRTLSYGEMLKVRCALGMDKIDVRLDCLHEINC